MSAPPPKVRIGPFTYMVSEFDREFRDANDIDGICIHETLEIKIFEGLAPGRKVEVLVHEVLHGCWYVAGLPNRTHEEQAVTSLSCPLIGVVAENPALMNWIALNLDR